MKKKNVIKKYSEFQTIIQKNRYKRNQDFKIYYHTRRLEEARVGILITKKHGNAVIRNKIKRQVREIVSKVLKFNECYDFVITITKNYDVNEFERYQKNLSALLHKILLGAINEEIN